MMLLVLLLAVPLSQRPINELTDAEMCQSLRDYAGSPASAIEGDDPIRFDAWDVDCDARILRANATVTNARVAEQMLTMAFAANSGFCTEPNLAPFWGRGWHFEVRVRFMDGRLRNYRPCEQGLSPA